MDIKCLHCGEPWDLYHLVHDIDEEELKEWQFGSSRAAILRCSSCSTNGPRLDKERAFAEATIIDLCADDLDAAAVMLGDLELMEERP